MILFLVMLILILAATPVNSLIKNLQGVYIDKIQLWDIAGPTHTSSQSAYNFTVNWRKQLSGVTASSLTLYNFKTGSHNILSFQAEIYPWVSSARVTLRINGTKSSIIFLAFSIVLKTDQSNFWEQHTLIFSPAHGYRAHQYLPVPSQLQGELKYYSVLLQWITAANPDSSYATYLFLLDYLHSNQSVQCTRSSIYSKGYAKISIFLISKETNGTDYVHHTMYKNNRWERRFIKNFGVNVSMYGSPVSGERCVNGLYYMQLHYSSYSTSLGYLLFSVYENNVVRVEYETVNGFFLATGCFGGNGEEIIIDVVPLPQPPAATYSLSYFILFLEITGCLAFLSIICYMVYRKNIKQQPQQLEITSEKPIAYDMEIPRTSEAVIKEDEGQPNGSEAKMNNLVEEKGVQFSFQEQSNETKGSS